MLTVSEKKEFWILSVILLFLTLAWFPLLAADITEFEATATSEEYIIVSPERFEMNRFVDRLAAYDYIESLFCPTAHIDAGFFLVPILEARRSQPVCFSFALGAILLPTRSGRAYLD